LFLENWRFSARAGNIQDHKAMKLLLLNLAGLLMAVAPLGAAPVDYVRDVKPLFAEHCFRCHGASQHKSELRMDTAAFALKGGDNGPALKPGNSADSLLVKLLKGTHPDLARMPYKKPPLSEGQITLVEEWIQQGAKAPADEAPESAKHWAFVSPLHGPPPVVKQADWPRSPVDNFILARLETDSIKPSPEADRATLIRRLSLDLTGLPPTVAQTDEFTQDQRPDAYERAVERLLASPHFGERWARHWLDVARYADSSGYSIDAPRSIWKYRDWVINAVNRNLPFDQFVIEQLAGDLLPNATQDQKIATGFHRNTQINQEGGIDPVQFQAESVLDRVSTTGTAFLGLTIGCAQCHDHKFDPLSQKEFYQMFAFFNSTVEDGHGQSAPGGQLEIPGETEAMEDLHKELAEAEAELGRFLDIKSSEVVKWEQSLTPEQTAKLKPKIRDVLKIPFAKRTITQKRAVYAVFHKDDKEFKERDMKLANLEKRQPKPVTTLVMKERSEPRESFIFIKGDFTRKGDPVTPGVPAILHPFKPAHEAPALANRLDLARWIVDPQNPLTARVIVNRVWLQYFGRGLVETENDFGTQGSLPSHPELLDWLATELIAQNWDLKKIHRLIVTSATYRQSSRVRSELATSDPNNRLLARQSRLRLDAEIVRDVGLSASGLLNEKIGGPSVYPPQPNGVMTLGQVKRDWKPSPGADRYRRGMYTYFWRATPHPALAVFDAADGFSACTRRLRSNTPLQALTLLNDEAFVEMAQALATRLLKEGPKTESERIALAFRLCLARQPAPAEKQRLAELLHKEFGALKQAPLEAAALGGQKADSKTDPTQLAALTTISRVLLNLDETITRE
jgi:mono/diheme cytochrome c family protein